MWLLFFWAFWIVLGVVLGEKKGRGAAGCLLGFFLGPLGVLIVWAMQGNRGTCPYCREPIHVNATACPHCQRAVTPANAP